MGAEIRHIYIYTYIYIYIYIYIHAHTHTRTHTHTYIHIYIQGLLFYPRGYVPGGVADIGIAVTENYFPIGINGNGGVRFPA